MFGLGFQHEKQRQSIAAADYKAQQKSDRTAIKQVNIMYFFVQYMLQKLTFVTGSSLLNSKRLLVAQLKVGGHSKTSRKKLKI